MSGPLLPGHAPFFSRRSMSMTSCRGRLICFGGVGAGGTESILDVTDECWLFDTRTMQWRPIARSAPWPSARRCPGFTAAPAGALLWGGSGVATHDGQLRYTFLNDCWRFDLESESWVELHRSDDHRESPIAESQQLYPSPRYTPVFQPAGDSGYFLYSGYTEDRLGKRNLDDAWMWDGARWSQVECDGPGGYDGRATWPGVRYGAVSAAADAVVYVFGGYSASGDHNDLWQFDASSLRWSLLSKHDEQSDRPEPRYCGAMAAHNGALIVFGGRSRRYPKKNFNDVWIFDVHARTWLRLTDNHGPHIYDASATSPGYHAKAAHAVDGDFWYLWGGEGRSGHVSDFWRFSLVERRWQMLQAARPDDPAFW
jgi:N-acetylneuraminic acid mutarotase